MQAVLPDLSPQAPFPIEQPGYTGYKLTNFPPKHKFPPNQEKLIPVSFSIFFRSSNRLEILHGRGGTMVSHFLTRFLLVKIENKTVNFD